MTTNTNELDEIRDVLIDYGGLDKSGTYTSGQFELMLNELARLIAQREAVAIQAFGEKLLEQKVLLPTTCKHSIDECQCKRYYVVPITTIQEELKGKQDG